MLELTKTVTTKSETHGDKLGESKDTFGLALVILVVFAKLLHWLHGDLLKIYNKIKIKKLRFKINKNCIEKNKNFPK